jgi:hypothetical protein
LKILSDTKSGLPAPEADEDRPAEVLGYALGSDFIDQCRNRREAPGNSEYHDVHVFRLGMRQSRVYERELDGLASHISAAGGAVNERTLQCPPFWSDGLHMWEELPELFEETVSCVKQL